MNCTEAQEQVELLATGDLPEAERRAVKAHISVCFGCATIASQYQEIVSALRSEAPPVRPDAVLLRTIMAATRAEIARARRRRSLNRFLAVSAAAAAVLLLALGVQLAHWWPRSAGRQAVVNPTPPALASGLPGPVAQVSLKEVWQHMGATAIPVSSAASAVLHGQNLYLLHENTADPQVVALDAASGRIQWQSQVRSIGYLSADDLRVYCLAAGADGSTQLVALDAGSGAILWRWHPDQKERLQYPCRAIPMPDGRVCWSTNTAVHMIDATRGQALWSRPVESEGLLSGAVLLDGQLLVASGRHLYGLSADAGETQWRQSLSVQGPVVGRPLLEADKGKAYLAERLLSGSQVTCIDPTGHKVLWTEKVSQPVFHLLAAAGRLYVRTQSVEAFDAAAGRPCWKWQAQGCGPVTFADGVVYFVDTTGSGRLVAVNAASGLVAWETAGIRSCEAVLAARSTAYLKTHDGVLRAVVLASQS